MALCRGGASARHDARTRRFAKPREGAAGGGGVDRCLPARGGGGGGGRREIGELFGDLEQRVRGRLGGACRGLRLFPNKVAELRRS